MNSFKRRLKATLIMLGTIIAVFLLSWLFAKYTLECVIAIGVSLLVYFLYHFWKFIYDELT